MTQRFRQRTLQPAVMRHIENNIVEGGLTATAIYEDVVKQFGHHVTSKRTVQDIVREYRPPDPSARWRFADANAEDAKLVLQVLGEGLALGLVQDGLTVAQAEWIARIRKAAPNIPAPMALKLELLYRSREQRNAPMHDLDAFLGLAPWEERDRYIRLAALGTISAVPAVDALLGFPTSNEIDYLSWKIDMWKSEEGWSPMNPPPRAIVLDEMTRMQNVMRKAPRMWLAEHQKLLARSFGIPGPGARTELEEKEIGNGEAEE